MTLNILSTTRFRGSRMNIQQLNFLDHLKEAISRSGGADLHLSKKTQISRETLRNWRHTPPTEMNLRNRKSKQSLQRLAYYLLMKDVKELFQGKHQEEAKPVLHVPPIVIYEPVQEEKQEEKKEQTKTIVNLYERKDEILKGLEKLQLILMKIDELKQRHSWGQLCQWFQDIHDMYELASQDMDAVKLVMEYLDNK